MITNSSGLSDSNYTAWLEDIKDGTPENLYNEVEDTRVMLGEVIYQLQNYQKAANLFVSKNPTHPLKNKVKAIVDSFGNINRSPAPQVLKQYWDKLAQKKVV